MRVFRFHGAGTGSNSYPVGAAWLIAAKVRALHHSTDKGQDKVKTGQ
jgi:hypothetical protein